MTVAPEKTVSDVVTDFLSSAPTLEEIAGKAVAAETAMAFLRNVRLEGSVFFIIPFSYFLY